jgi:hypothetical protein
MVGWVGGGEIEIRAKLSPAKAGAWAELGNNDVSVISTFASMLQIRFGQKKMICFFSFLSAAFKRSPDSNKVEQILLFIMSIISLIFLSPSPTMGNLYPLVYSRTVL